MDIGRWRQSEWQRVIGRNDVLVTWLNNAESLDLIYIFGICQSGKTPLADSPILIGSAK